MARKHQLPNGTVWTITDSKTAEARLQASQGAVVRWLNAYQPRSATDPDGQWAKVSSFVRVQLARIQTLDVTTVKRYARTLAALAIFCVKEEIPLDVERVLHPATVERFSYTVAKTYPASSTATWRSDLRRLGVALTASAPWEPAPKAYPHTPLRPPYSDRELALIRRDIARQRSGELNRAALAMMSLGLGVGADGRWVHRITGSMVTGTGPVDVHIPDPERRRVTVREPYEMDVARLASLRDGALIGSFSTSKNLVSRLAADIVIAGGRVEFDPKRLRSTWLTDLLVTGTPINVILDAAGLKTTRSLQVLIEMMDPPDDDVRQRLLRGV